MPVHNGLHIATTLRAKNPELAVVFISGYMDDMVDRRLLTQLGGPLLEKPFVGRVLIDKVQEALRLAHEP